MKCVTTQYGNKIVITINLKVEPVDIFTPKRFDSKAIDLEKKLEQLDKGMILKVTERKGKDNNNYLDIWNYPLNIKNTKVLHFISNIYKTLNISKICIKFLFQKTCFHFNAHNRK